MSDEHGGSATAAQGTIAAHRDRRGLVTAGDDVVQLRHEVAEVIDQSNLDDRSRLDTILIASELLTNARVHGAGGPISVELTPLHSGAMRLRVSNRARPDRAIPEPTEWTLAAPLSVSGRGLGIVAALVDAAAVVRAPAETHVSVVFTPTRR